MDVREAENDDEEVLVWGTFRGNEWENKGPVVGVRKLGSEEEGGEEERVWGFEVKALGGKEYFVQRAGCKSPIPRPSSKSDKFSIAGERDKLADL